MINLARYALIRQLGTTIQQMQPHTNHIQRLTVSFIYFCFGWVSLFLCLIRGIKVAVHQTINCICIHFKPHHLPICLFLGSSFGFFRRRFCLHQLFFSFGFFVLFTWNHASLSLRRSCVILIIQLTFWIHIIVVKI